MKIEIDLNTQQAIKEVAKNVSIATAVVFGLVITKNANCLWALFFLT